MTAPARVTSDSATLQHYLTQHVPPDVVLIPVDWLPRNGRHWALVDSADAVALSLGAWESGAVDGIFAEVGITVRNLRRDERLPQRTRCQLCGPHQVGQLPRPHRPTVNELGLLARRP